LRSRALTRATAARATPLTRARAAPHPHTAYGGDNGGALAAQLSTPEGLAVDSEGSIFVADYANHRVRKLLAQAGIAVQQR
jgi:hypothetical protein